MSAICGMVRFDDKPIERSEIEAMVASSPHRGPDGARFWLDGNFGAAHSAFQLAPDSGPEEQPLVSPDAQFILIADVRLDNRQELAVQLGMSPPQRRRLSDPGLLLQAYLKWGEHCPTRLLGDFAFAVWDQASQRLFMARDPLGARGLFFSRLDRSLYFASEIGAVITAAPSPPGINHSAVARTLAGFGLRPEETYFESVEALPPAHFLVAEPGQFKTDCYWRPDPERRIEYHDEREYTDHLSNLLEQAVSCRLPAGVPAGISLSGGHDSTLLAAIAADQGPLKSFSYVFDRFQSCDERQWIEPVARHCGIEAHYVQAGKLWPFSQRDPFAVPRDFLWTNPYAQLPESVARAAGGAGCRILIDGMFGDALFCEPSLFAADLLRRGRLLELLRLMEEAPRGVDWTAELVHRGLRPLLPNGLRQAWRRWHPVPLKQQAPALSDEWARKLSKDDTWRPRAPSAWTREPGRNVRYQRIFQPLWAHGLAATQSNPYNRNGIERVSPYFDRRLVEFVLAIPTEQVSHAGRPRRLQNNAMRRRLPAAVADRRGKTSFEALLRHGLKDAGRATVERLCVDSVAVQHGLVDGEWLRRQRTEPDDLYLLSQYLHVELWLRAVLA